MAAGGSSLTGGPSGAVVAAEDDPFRRTALWAAWEYGGPRDTPPPVDLSPTGPPRAERAGPPRKIEAALSGAESLPRLV
jgi:hypothetical protein